MTNITTIWIVITMFVTCGVVMSIKSLESMLPNKRRIYEAFYTRQVNIFVVEIIYRMK